MNRRTPAAVDVFHRTVVDIGPMLRSLTLWKNGIDPKLRHAMLTMFIVPFLNIGLFFMLNHAILSVFTVRGVLVQCYSIKKSLLLLKITGYLYKLSWKSHEID